MATFLNQIFYKCNKFDNMQSIQNLNPYMLDLHNMKKIIESIDKKEYNTDNSLEAAAVSIVEKNILKETNKKSTVFFPQRENSLFWCMFIANYGYAEYEYIGKKYANRELHEKQLIADTLRKDPQLMKNSNHKITNVAIKEIISELMVDKKSKLSTIFAFVTVYKKNVFIFKDKTYLYFSCTKSSLQDDNNQFDDNTVIIEYQDDDFGIDLEVTQDKVTEILKNTLQLESIEKPLKGISAYKVSELEDMGRVLDIKLEVAVKKSELYEIIYKQTVWECQKNS